MANTGFLRDWKWFWDNGSSNAKNPNVVKTSRLNLTVQEAKDNYFLDESIIDNTLSSNEMIAHDSIKFAKFMGGFNNTTNGSITDSVNGYTYVVGNFTKCHNWNCGRIVRLYDPLFNTLNNKDYAVNKYVDTTFTTGVGFNDEVKCIMGRYSGTTLTGLYVGGAFTTYNGVSCNNIVCLDLNGNIDTSFDIGTGLNGTVWTIQLSPLLDGTIYVGGEFTTYKGIQQKHIVQLNSNGSKVSTFLQTNFPGTVFAIAFMNYPYSNPRWIMFLGGFFSYKDYRNRTGNNLVECELSGIDLNRYNDNLLVEPAYNVNGPVYCIKIFEKADPTPIIIGGSFTSINNVSHNNFAILSWIGYSANRFFNVEGEVRTIVSGTAQYSLLVGGYFQAAGMKTNINDSFKMVPLNKMFLLDNGNTTGNTSPNSPLYYKLRPITEWSNRGLFGGSVLHIGKVTNVYFFCSGSIMESTIRYEKCNNAGYIAQQRASDNEPSWHYNSNSEFSTWFNPDNA